MTQTNTYMAVVKKINYTRPVKIRFQATDNSTALDTMHTMVGATKAEEIVEYELYQEIGVDRYISVAFKPLSYTLYDVEETKKSSVRTFTEKAYTSYKQAA